MKNILTLFVFIVAFQACKVDNYEEANLTISGKIVDAESGTLIESGGSNGGTIVKFYQGNSSQALLFKTKPDGTFTHSKVFPGSYRYVAEGPFGIMTDTPVISIQKNTDIQISVLPNVRLSASIVSKSETEAVIKVSYTKVQMAQTITKIGAVWSTVTQPNIFTFAGGDIFTENVASGSNSSGEKLITLKNLKDKVYFLRAFAATDAAGNYYNYSSQIEVK